MKTNEIPEAMKRVPLARLTRKRQQDWRNPPRVCDCCGGPVRLVSNAEVYGRAMGAWPFAYKCDKCGAAVGVHPESIYPIGTMADRQLRESRKRVQDGLERLRRASWMTNQQARESLARLMNIPVAACRIAMFSVEDCRKALAALVSGPV